MSLAMVVEVAEGSPAHNGGVRAGDTLVAVNGEALRDVIQFRVLTDEPEVSLSLRRGGLDVEVEVTKAAGAPLGIEVDAAVFDRIRTCDNHCEFCFIYQLPPGMRKSLYLKDDDYRLSFLYGNFTTLTRFTEADLERVITEGLSPLYVSIHATDPQVRSDMLRNRRGATSLWWLRALLEHGVEVHGQVVVCPGVNDAEVLADTLCGVLDEYPQLATLAVVPLGVSRHHHEPRMRPHTPDEAEAVLDLVHLWQGHYLRSLGRRLVHAADEYYLLAGRPFPEADQYEGFGMHEDGIGMARTFEAELRGLVDSPIGTQAGFFSWVDGAPADGYRAPRTHPDGCGPGTDLSGTSVTLGSARRSSGGRSGRRPVTVLTGELGALVLGPLLADLRTAEPACPEVEVVGVPNRFFGGNIGVSGLLVGADLAPAVQSVAADRRILIPDVCLSRGRFLDDTTPADLPRPVEIVATDGVALRTALGLPRRPHRAAAPERRAAANVTTATLPRTGAHP